MASAVVTARIDPGDKSRLARHARRAGRSESDLVASFIHEALEQKEFAFIEFRDSPLGRQPYLKGSRLAVWQVMHLAKGHDHDPAKVADYFEKPLPFIQAAFNYAEAHPEEIAQAIADHEAIDFEQLKRTLPGIEKVSIR